MRGSYKGFPVSVHQGDKRVMHRAPFQGSWSNKTAPAGHFLPEAARGFITFSVGCRSRESAGWGRLPRSVSTCFPECAP